MCAWYCVSTSPCLWLISFISWNMALTNCWVEMTSSAGHVTWRAWTSQWILLLPVRFLQISASRTALQTTGCPLRPPGPRPAWVHVLRCVKEREDSEGEGNDRRLGPAVSCHSVPITTPLASERRSPGSSKLLHASGTVLEASWTSIWQRGCEGKARRESRNEARAHFPRCSWLLSAPEDLSEHFQNKEFVCVGAQIASPRIYAHLHTDRDTLTLGHKKCYSNSF